VFYKVRKRLVHEHLLDGLVTGFHQDLVDGNVIRLPHMKAISIMMTSISAPTNATTPPRTYRPPPHASITRASSSYRFFLPPKHPCKNHVPRLDHRYDSNDGSQVLHKPRGGTLRNKRNEQRGAGCRATGQGGMHGSRRRAGKPKGTQ
jgi:hypothetical protein